MESCSAGDLGSINLSEIRPQLGKARFPENKFRFLGQTMTKGTWCVFPSDREVLLLVRSGSGKSAFELTNVGIWRSARAEGELVMGSKASGRVFKPAGSASDGEVQDGLSKIGWNDRAHHREGEHVAVICRDRVSSGDGPNAHVHNKRGHQRVMAEMSGFAFRNDGLGIKGEMEGNRRNNSRFFPFKGYLVPSYRGTSKGQHGQGSQQEGGFE
jgi:hypothetical protein